MVASDAVMVPETAGVADDPGGGGVFTSADGLLPPGACPLAPPGEDEFPPPGEAAGGVKVGVPDGGEPGETAAGDGEPGETAAGDGEPGDGGRTGDTAVGDDEPGDGGDTAGAGEGVDGEGGVVAGGGGDRFLRAKTTTVSF